MDRSFFVVARRTWLLGEEPHPKRLQSQQLCPVGPGVGHLGDECNLLVKFRQTAQHREGTSAGRLATDASARIQALKGTYYIKSEQLCAHLLASGPTEDLVVFFFEGMGGEARCVVDSWPVSLLDAIAQADPTLRLDIYGLPPVSATTVEAPQHVAALYHEATSRDPELYVAHVSRFLDAPHIITALFSHLLSLRAEDDIRFPIQVKKLAEQLRTLLQQDRQAPQIKFIQKSHVDLWAEVQGQRFGFLDGGVARIPSMPGIEPMAMRVGVYSVRPGVAELREREAWTMRPYVIGDLIDRSRPLQERFESRRLLEAARYTLEPLTAIEHLKSYPNTRTLLMHGPLVNQFVQYDEGEPHFIPFLAPEFLAKAGIERARVLQEIKHIPEHRGEPMWNHFMATYALVMRTVNDSPVPIAGVVERPLGRPVTEAVLQALLKQGVVADNYVRAVGDILDQYDITDDFLFGCILREGEYVTPVITPKNPPHKARERWQPVVRQIPAPAALLMKSEDANFPFRVEMNTAAAAVHEFVARFMYHTARLLPRYAFPVGLDIADKFAKIPDWISKGVSASLSASVLRRAMQTGDPHVITQIRLLLAHGPRDFFYRPSAKVL